MTLVALGFIVGLWVGYHIAQLPGPPSVIFKVKEEK